MTEISENEIQDKTEMQAVLFGNRLKKRYRHLRKWAARTEAGCYRLYDRDIPEIPLAVDLYTEAPPSLDLYLHISLYERPYDKPEEEEKLWLEAMMHCASETLGIPKSRIFSKIRRRQKGDAQYEKVTEYNHRITVIEQGLRFRVNLSDYLDTGLFFDHRITRSLIRSTAAGKKVLNLFCYTGSFSVYAAAGGAAAVDSVDISSTYLSRAEENLALNSFNDSAKYRFIRQDVKLFLKESASREKHFDRCWDIIILDPPTFSNSKRAEEPLDINREWPFMVNTCLTLLTPDGVLYFSSNSRRLKFSGDLLTTGFQYEDITEKTIPEDFKNHKSHICYRIFPKKI